MRRWEEEDGKVGKREGTLWCIVSGPEHVDYGLASAIPHRRFVITLQKLQPAFGPRLFIRDSIIICPIVTGNPEHSVCWVIERRQRQLSKYERLEIIKSTLCPGRICSKDWIYFCYQSFKFFYDWTGLNFIYIFFFYFHCFFFSCRNKVYCIYFFFIKIFLL